MAGPIEMTDAGKDTGLPAEALQTAPEREGYDIVEDFGNGSAIYRSKTSGNEVFVDSNSGYSSPDPDIIKLAREGGRQAVGQRSQEGFAGQGVRDTAGGQAQRIMNLGDYMPGLRGYLPGIAEAASGGKVSPELYDMAIEDYRTQNPVQSVAEGFGGAGAIGAILGLPAIGGNLLRRTVLGGAAGTAGGATEGYIAGYGRGGTEGAAEEAVPGAIGGGLFGLALPGVGAGISSAYGRYLEKPVRSVLEDIGFKGKAAEVAKDFIAMDSATAVQSAEQAGPYGSIGMLGPNTEALLDTVANTPGEARKTVIENVTDTARKASNDLTDAADDVLGKPVGDLEMQKRTIMDNSREARTEAYGEAYSVPVDIGTAEGAQLADLYSQVPARILNRVNETLQLEGLPTLVRAGRYTEAQLNELMSSGQQLANLDVRSMPDGSYTVRSVPSIENIDDLSRQLYNMASGITEDPGAKSALRGLATKMRQVADEVSPAFKQARLEGKTAIDQKAAAELGDSLLNPKVTRQQIADELANMGDVEVAQVKQALRNRLDEIAANAKNPPTGRQEQEVIEALAQLRAMNTRAVASKLRSVLGAEDFEKFSNQIASTTGALMMNASIAANSRTYIRNQVEQRFREIIGEPMGDAIRNQGLVGAATERGMRGFFGPSQSEQVQEVAAEMAPILTQRMTPEDLLRQAQALERATPAITRAQRGRRQARQAVGALGFGPTVTQGEEDSPTRRLLLSLGLR